MFRAVALAIFIAFQGAAFSAEFPIVINAGTAPNDGTGVSLRQSMLIINSNFAMIHAQLITLTNETHGLSNWVETGGGILGESFTLFFPNLWVSNLYATNINLNGTLISNIVQFATTNFWVATTNETLVSEKLTGSTGASVEAIGRADTGEGTVDIIASNDYEIWISARTDGGLIGFYSELGEGELFSEFRPGSADGNASWTLGTFIPHTTGNILEVKNAGTDVFTIDAVSGHTGTGSKVFLDNGKFQDFLTNISAVTVTNLYVVQHIFINGTNVGTINPTTGAIPIKTGENSFGDLVIGDWITNSAGTLKGAILPGDNVTFTTNNNRVTVASAPPPNTMIGPVTSGYVPYAIGPTNFAPSQIYIPTTNGMSIGDLTTNHIRIVTSSANAELVFFNDGATEMTYFRPNIAGGSTPYILDTDKPHTSGDLLRVQNFGSAKLIVTATNVVFNGTTAGWYVGTGDPNTQDITNAAKGSFFSRTDGGAGTSFYVKENAGANWVGK